MKIDVMDLPATFLLSWRIQIHLEILLMKKKGYFEANFFFINQCEEVCRLALKRRYRLIPHIYTLFYLAHTRGTPVASPAFFAGEIIMYT